MSASRKPLMVAMVAATLLLTACGTPSEPPTEGQSPPPSAPSEASASPSPSASALAPTTTGEDEPCTVDALDVTAATGDAGAGSVTVTFTFQNVGGAPCTLEGFPGVSAVGDGDGTQIGEPARRSDRPYEQVVVASGDTATANLRMVDVGSGGGPLGDACQAQPADGWRIYPPGSTQSIFVAVDGLTACAGDVDWITIDPVVG